MFALSVRTGKACTVRSALLLVVSGLTSWLRAVVSALTVALSQGPRVAADQEDMPNSRV